MSHLSETKFRFYDQYAEIGGGQLVMLQALGLLKEAGVESLSVVAPAEGLLQAEISKRFGGQVHFIESKIPQPKSSRNIFSFVGLLLFSIQWVLLEGLQKSKDVVEVVNGPRWLFALYLKSFFSENKTVIFLHLKCSPFQKRILALLLLKSSTLRLICVSDFLKNDFLATSKMTFGKQKALFENMTSKITVLENSLSEGFQKNIENQRHGVTNLTKDLHCVTIGRLIPEKGQEVVVKAAQNFPDITFYIVGSSKLGHASYERSLRKQAPKNVIFLGERYDLFEMKKEFGWNLAITPSIVEESFGLAAIESLGMGLFTLIRPQGALADIALKAEAMTFRNINDLQKNLAEVESWSPQELSRRGLMQQKVILEHYNIEKYRLKFLAVFSDLTRLTPATEVVK